MSEQFWYRVDGHRYAAPVDEFDNPVGIGRCDVHVYSLRVVRTTPKGVWLEAFGAPRFVLRDARKKYASPTESEALLSFIARKKRQENILKAQMRTAIELADIALEMLHKRKAA